MIRMKLFHDLLQRLCKISDQAAADTPGIHLGNIDPGFLEKTSVNSDLAKFILYKHYLLARKNVADQLPDQSGFPGSEESGDNIDLCHLIPFFLKTLI